jgi:hypothetical protein
VCNCCSEFQQEVITLAIRRPVDQWVRKKKERSKKKEDHPTFSYRKKFIQICQKVHSGKAMGLVIRAPILERQAKKMGRRIRT